MTYAAFGLSLRSSFALPGMIEGEAGGLPSIELAIESPAELDGAWSGAIGAAPWRGRLGDGIDLTIEWGVAGDLRIAYGDRASFRLGPSRRRLGCAPRQPASLEWQRVLLTRVLPNVSIARGYEALHASAVETPLGVLAIAAPSGMGKSTLAGEMIGRGWPLFADDVLVLSRLGERVEAFPAPPHMNISPGAASGKEIGTTLGVLAGERWASIEAVSRRPRRVAAVVVLERSPGLAFGVDPLPGTPLALAPYMLGLPDEEGRDASRFELYADLVESARLLRVSGDTEDSPARFADAIERALGLGRQAATVRSAA